MVITDTVEKEDIDPLALNKPKKESLDERIDRLRPNFIKLGYLRSLEPPVKPADIRKSLPLQHQPQNLINKEAKAPPPQKFIKKEVKYQSIILTSPPSIPIKPKFIEKPKIVPSPSFTRSSFFDPGRNIPKTSINPEFKDKISPLPFPPRAKKIKLEYKHSFNFINANPSPETSTSRNEKKLHRAIFRHFDFWMKKDTRAKAYEELSTFLQELWPNPRKLENDDKVNAANINEFNLDDLKQKLLNEALNNNVLFETHEVIYAKKHISQQKKSIQSFK